MTIYIWSSKNSSLKKIQEKKKEKARGSQPARGKERKQSLSNHSKGGEFLFYKLPLLEGGSGVDQSPCNITMKWRSHTNLHIMKNYIVRWCSRRAANCYPIARGGWPAVMQRFQPQAKHLSSQWLHRCVWRWKRKAPWWDSGLIVFSSWFAILWKTKEYKGASI